MTVQGSGLLPPDPDPDEERDWLEGMDERTEYDRREEYFDAVRRDQAWPQDAPANQAVDEAIAQGLPPF